MQEVLGPHKIMTRRMKYRPGEEVTLRVRAGAFEIEEPRFQYLEVMFLGSKTRLCVIKVEAPADEPEIIEIPLRVPHGHDSMQLILQPRTYQQGSMQDSGYYRTVKKELGTPIGLWVDWVEVVTSGLKAGYTPQMEYFLPEKPKTMSEGEYVKVALERFTNLAFRGKPASEEYMTKLIAHFQKKRDTGASLDEALIEPMSLALTSPSFLYMVEGGKKSEVDPSDLAVRLSYFLWGSPLDLELMALGKSGELKTPAVLSAEVERLLADPRSQYFIEGFCYQWLHMSRLGMFPFDTAKHHGFDNSVMDSARKEIYELFKHTIEHNLPIGELLDANYVIVDQVMADHYGFKDFTGRGFQKVMLPEGSHRGGLLGTAGFHAIGSDGVNSSPVERGVWVLKHLLGMSPPPPPPNIPQLDRVKDGFVTVREMVKMHQEAPQCAQCHQYIDPVGMGLEQFDAAGRWRTSEVVTFEQQEKTFPIDASGNLPFGDSFADFYGLHDAVAKQDDKFANVLIEELIRYSLGREFQFTDRDLAESILKNTEPGGYKLKDLIKEIILSDKFVSK